MYNGDFDIEKEDYECYELDLEEFIQRFRKTIYEEPEEIPKFLDVYKRFAEENVKDIDPRDRDKVALEIIAGYCVLADYDGILISHSLEDGFDSLIPFFDDPKEYGLAMAALSTHLGLEGEVLGEFVLGDYTLH